MFDCLGQELFIDDFVIRATKLQSSACFSFGYIIGFDKSYSGRDICRINGCNITTISNKFLIFEEPDQLIKLNDDLKHKFFIKQLSS